MSKRFFYFVLVFVTALFLSACGDKSDDVDKDVPDEKLEEKDDKGNKDEEDEDKDKDEEDDENKDDERINDDDGKEEASSIDFSKLIKHMEEETEGEAKVIYENNEPKVHETEGVSISLDGYTLVELADFHTNFAIPFNDQTDGGVIIAHYTVTNDTEDDIHYMPTLDASYVGATKVYSNNRDLLPEEEQLVQKLSPSTEYLLKENETVSGYYAYSFGQDHLDEILELETVEVEVPQAQLDMDDYDSRIGEEGKFNLSLTEDGAEKLADNEKFYKDKVTFDNMGDKKMLKDKEGINETEKVSDFKVTLDGYQFTEFTPNKEEAPRFSNFENGIVLLTIKFDIENKSSEDIGLSSMSSKLLVNDGAQWILDTGMLLNYRNSDLIKTGESGELLQVYALDQEQYEKIWKDKSFEVEVGPMKNEEAKDISKGKTAVFELPN